MRMPRRIGEPRPVDQRVAVHEHSPAPTESIGGQARAD